MVQTIERAGGPASGLGLAGRGAALLAALRPRQWVKNLFCFAGLVFSGRLFQAGALAQAGASFVAFCLAASSVYLLNDVVDREKDRRNPRTARRPVASGALPVAAALAACVVLGAAACALSAPLGRACLLALGLYAATNVAYSTRLKHAVIADVMCIALGFVLRVLHGVYAVRVLPTAWIVLCMFFLALFLGFAKRKAELGQARPGAGSEGFRPVLDDYTAPYLDILLAMSATMAILCYALFSVVSHRNATLVVTVVPVVYCVYRYLFQIFVLGRGEAPEEILLSDRRLWAGIVAWALLCVAVLYGDLRLFTESIEWFRPPAP